MLREQDQKDTSAQAEKEKAYVNREIRDKKAEKQFRVNYIQVPVDDNFFVYMPYRTKARTVANRLIKYANIVTSESPDNPLTAAEVDVIVQHFVDSALDARAVHRLPGIVNLGLQYMRRDFVPNNIAAKVRRPVKANNKTYVKEVVEKYCFTDETDYKSFLEYCKVFPKECFADNFFRNRKVVYSGEYKNVATGDSLRDFSDSTFSPTGLFKNLIEYRSRSTGRAKIDLDKIQQQLEKAVLESISTTAAREANKRIKMIAQYVSRVPLLEEKRKRLKKRLKNIISDISEANEQDKKEDLEKRKKTIEDDIKGLKEDIATAKKRDSIQLENIKKEVNEFEAEIGQSSRASVSLERKQKKPKKQSSQVLTEEDARQEVLLKLAKDVKKDGTNLITEFLFYCCIVWDTIEKWRDANKGAPVYVPWEILNYLEHCFIAVNFPWPIELHMPVEFDYTAQMALYAAGASDDATQRSRAIANLRERKLLCDTEMQEQVKFVIESLDKFTDGIGASEWVNIQFQLAQAEWKKLEPKAKGDIHVTCREIFDAIQQNVFLVDKFRDEKKWFEKKQEEVEKTWKWLDGEEKQPKKNTRTNVVIDDSDKKLILTSKMNDELAEKRKELIERIRNDWGRYKESIKTQYPILENVALTDEFWEQERLLRHHSANQFCIKFRKKAEQWAIFWCDTPKATQQLYQKLLDDKIDHVAGLSGDGEEDEEDEDDAKKQKDKAFETKRAFLRLHKRLTETPIEYLNHQPPRFRATVISNLGTFLNLYVKAREWSRLPPSVSSSPLVQKYNRLLVMQNPELTVSRSSNVKWRLHMPSADEVISDTINLARLDSNLPVQLLRKDPLLDDMTPLQAIESVLVPYSRHLIMHPVVLSVAEMPDAMTNKTTSPILAHLDHYFSQKLQEIQNSQKSTSSNTVKKKRPAPVPLITPGEAIEEKHIVPFCQIPMNFDPFESLNEEDTGSSATKKRKRIPKKPVTPKPTRAKIPNDLSIVTKPSTPRGQPSTPRQSTPLAQPSTPRLVRTNTKGHLQLVTKARFSADHVLCPKGVLLVF